MKARIVLFILLFLCALIAPALASDTYMGFVTSKTMNNVMVFDPNTNTITTTFSTGNNPVDVEVNPGGSRIYVSNKGDNTIWVYDSTYTHIATITLPTLPSFMMMSPTGDKLYVNTYSSSLYVIDTSTNTISNTITLLGATEGELYYNPNTNIIYAVESTSDKIAVIDASTNTVSSYINVGGNPLGIVGSTITNKLYVSNFNDNTVTIINMNNNAVITTIAVGARPAYLGMKSDGSKIYIPNNNGHTVSIIDGTSNTVIATPATGGQVPQAAAVEPNNQRAYITDYSTNDIAILDTSTNAITGNIATSYSGPGSIVISKIASETTTTTPMQVTFNANNAGVIYYSDLNVSVFDAYTGVFIASDPTDTAGNSIFWLIPGKRYTITVSGNGVTPVSQTVQVQPTQDRYSINVVPNTEWWNPFAWFNTNGSSTTGSPDQSKSITAKRTGTLIGTTGYLDVVYNDSTGKTSSVNMSLYEMNSTTGLSDYKESQVINANDGEHNFTILGASGKTYRVNISATNPLYGTVYREGSWTFTPTYSYDMGWPTYFYLFFAIGVSLIIGYLTSKRNTLAGGAMLIVFLGAFWSIGWMSSLGLAMPILLGVLTILLVVYAVAKWRLQNGV